MLTLYYFVIKILNLQLLKITLFLLILVLPNLGSKTLYATVFNLNNTSTNKNKYLTNVLSTKSLDNDQSIEILDLLSNVEDFINLPEGGTPWQLFGETGEEEYKFIDDEGFEWVGVRPNFTKNIKKLESEEILVQGYMFPLDQGEKQKTFLIVPFPPSCPYYPHVSPNLIIEVHASPPITYSYDAINVKGKLELVHKDDLYNIFYRLKDAKLFLD